MRNAYEEYLAKLPKDWKRSSIGTVGTVCSGGTPRRSVPDYWNGDIPWVTPSELTVLKEKYLRSTAEKITRKGLASSSATLVPKDALLVTTRATIGSLALTAVPMTTNQGCQSVIFNTEADPHFYYYLFSGLSQEFMRRASGTTFLELAGREFRAVEIPCPPLIEQHRIAEVLDALSGAIQQTEQILSKLQQVKVGLLHDLLTRGIDENGELRNARRCPNEFKDSPLGCVPKQWDLQPIGRLANHITSGSRGWASFYADSGPLFLRIGNLSREHINLRLENLVHVRPPAGGEGRRTALEPNDLLISITADLGIIGVFPSGLGEAYVNQHIALVRLDSSQVNPRWVGHFLAGGAGQQQFKRLDDVGAKSGLNLPTVAGLNVAVPRRAEQDMIVSILDAQDDRIRREAACAGKLRSLKLGLMEDLLTGRVRVPVLEEVTF